MKEGVLDKRRRRSLERYEKEYEKLKKELATTGYIVRGSVTERWMACGKPECACHVDTEARHGPYYQWSWKDAGRTVSCYLDKDRATLCRTWVSNSRRLDRILTRMRSLSLRVARLYEIAQK
jgi:hypothetical protein